VFFTVVGSPLAWLRIQLGTYSEPPSVIDAFLYLSKFLHVTELGLHRKEKFQNGILSARFFGAH